MKKLLLSIFSTCIALASTAQAPEAKWGKLIDGGTSAGDQSTDVAIAPDGSVYWYGTYGSTEASPDINYGGSLLFKGAPLNIGNTQNNNYTVLKTDGDGNKIWCVYSNSGDFANNSGFCSATSDGGLITVAKVRHTDGMLDKNINLVGADGKDFPIQWTVEKRYYGLAVTKISAEGSIEWNRMINFSTEPGPKASGNYAEFWADVFNVPGGTLDEDDNIYIALNYRNPVTIARAEGDPVVLTPTNTSTWTGDSQTAAGDFLILALDKDGYYRNNLQLEGDCSVSYCQTLAWNNGSLFAQGYITGKDNGVLKAGNFQLAPSNIMSPLLLCTDSNLDVKWAKCFKGEQVAGKNALQSTNITADKNGLYFCGQYNLKFSDPDDSAKFVTSEQGAIREGFIVKIDPATGAWLAARDSRSDNWDKPSAVAKTGLTGYMSVIVNSAHPEKIYAFGYVMNANVGVFLREYDSETLVGCLPEGQYNIVTGGGVPSCQAAAYESKSGAFYLTARGNNVFNLLDGISTEKPSGWGILAARYDLPEAMFSGIENVASDIDDTDAPVEYFNLQGVRVQNPANGLYIRRQGSHVEKVRL
ncbi:MAG: hypothetical protein K2K84_08685 [Muribaculaceae bacterium]|nr:hypothetical protein [Muribaculaceae bacterium]